MTDALDAHSLSSISHGVLDDQTMLDHMTVAMVVLNRDHHIVRTNPAFQALLGYSADQLLQLNYRDITDPTDWLAEASKLQEVWSGHVKGHYYQKQLLTQTGCGLTVQVIASDLRDSSGQPVAIALMAIAVTEPNSTPSSRQPSTANTLPVLHHSVLDPVFDTVTVAVSVLDPTGHIVRVNAASCQLLGYTPDELIGLPYATLIHPSHRGLNTPGYRALIRGKRDRYVTEQPFVCKDGSLTWGRVTISASRDADRTLQFLTAVCEDINEQKQTEAILRQQLEQEHLLGNITHVIRHTSTLEASLPVTVHEVRRILRADRVVVCRLHPGPMPLGEEGSVVLPLSPWRGDGVVVAESVGAEWISMVGKCFQEACPLMQSWRKHRGQVQAIANIYQSRLSSAYVACLEQYQVVAHLGVPIYQADALWGMILVQQCASQRTWKSVEISFLQQLADRIACATEQTELYHQVQRLNADLERKVQMRTAELQLASEFEATLKRITDKVRDSLDENQILETAVRELAVVVGVSGCNAALYDLKQETSTICYEYASHVPPYQGKVAQMRGFPEIYDQLLQGQTFQFCSTSPNPVRGPVAMLACPIFDDQGVLGDLWLINHKFYGFNQQDIRLVQQVANQCAIALRQARLYKTAQMQVRELERLNQLKDDFLSTVSHELRTPVASIRMAAQLLAVNLNRAGIADEFKTQIDRYLRILQDECEREITLINDLLDLSRLESNQGDSTLTSLSLQEWLLPLIQPFMERVKRQQQQFKLELPDNLPVVITNSSQLSRILIELLNNACKYTPPGETITLCATQSLGFYPPSYHAAPLREPSAADMGHGMVSPGVVISIHNSGAEIAPEEQSRIFDKFYRVPHSDRWKYGGTGLGLALSKKLSEELGGALTVSSRDGGTTFSLYVPLAPALLA